MQIAIEYAQFLQYQEASTESLDAFSKWRGSLRG